MPGLRDFVSDRHNGLPDSMRSSIGNQSRVPVPATKLQRENPNTTDQTFDSSVTNADIPGRGTAFARPSHGDAFDTDAEDLDDTTVISSVYSDRSRPDGHDNRGRVDAYQMGPVFHHKARLDRLENEDLVDDQDDGEVSDESLSEEEESDEAELPPSIVVDQNRPGFVKFHRENPSSRDDLLRSLNRTASPSIRQAGTPKRLANTANDSTRPIHHNPLNRAASIDGFSSRQDSLGTRLLNHPLERKGSVPLVSSQHHDLIPHSEDAQKTSNHSAMKEQGVPRTQAETNKPLGAVALEALSEPVALEKTKEQRPIDITDKLDDDFSFVHQSGNESSEDFLHASAKESQSRKRALDLDYSMADLSQMTYEQLSKEPFERTPENTGAQLPKQLLSGSLSERLDLTYSMKPSKDRDSHRKAFFASLTIDQYEECAGLILNRFSGIITKFKEARQRKRKATSEFEEEVAQREERVRNRRGGLEQDLKRLKQGGEDVVRGRANQG